VCGVKQRNKSNRTVAQRVAAFASPTPRALMPLEDQLVLSERTCVLVIGVQ
jgi:hypothetical protein